nr:recombinase RecT [Niallia circulans]
MERLVKKVIGYCGFFKLTNSFEKTVYWTRDEVEAHRIKHNKMKDKKAMNNVWKSDYDAMAMKTVVRNMLSKSGILSVEMQKAVSEDENEERELKDITNEIDEPTIDDNANIFDYEVDNESKEEKPSFDQGSIDFE